MGNKTSTWRLPLKRAGIITRHAVIRRSKSRNSSFSALHILASVLSLQLVPGFQFFYTKNTIFSPRPQHNLPDTWCAHVHLWLSAGVEAIISTIDHTATHHDTDSHSYHGYNHERQCLYLQVWWSKALGAIYNHDTAWDKNLRGHGLSKTTQI